MKKAATVELIRELAEVTGESLTDAVTTAVRERLERVSSEQPHPIDIERVLALAEEIRRRMDPEALAIDHGDLLYDELGLPK